MSSRSKKPIIRKMARLAGGIFALAALIALVGAIIVEGEHKARMRHRQRKQQELVERARGLLGEFAKRAVRLPIDPAVISEIESRYYEELPTMRMYVWGFDTQGGFLFGVPGDAFERLNRIYDAHLEQIQKDRHFANRHEFLRELIQSHEELSFIPADPVQERGWARGRTWRHYRDERRDHTVLSTPLRAPGDAVLGNLYIKIVPVRMPDFSPDVAEGMAIGGSMVMTLAGIFLWFLLPSWVYVDACERGVRRAGLWSFLVLISFVIGLVVYLIARPEHPTVLECPGCGHEINGGAFCPYCGHDVSTVFCAICRYPLKPDWIYCPSCRAEIKPSADTTPQAEDGGPGAA